VETPRPETGFKTLTFQEFRQLGISRLDPKPKVVFVNRRKAFKPPEDLLRGYEDLMRRYEGHAKQKQFEIRELVKLGGSPSTN